MDQIVEVPVPALSREPRETCCGPARTSAVISCGPGTGCRNLLLRQGILYSRWAPVDRGPRERLRGQRFASPGLQLAFDTALETELLTTTQRNRLDTAVSEMAFISEYGGAPVVLPA
jgi:transposase